VKRIMISPLRYVQAAGEFNRIEEYIRSFGKKAILIASVQGQRRMHSSLSRVMNQRDLDIGILTFQGECSKSEVHRIRNSPGIQDCDVVIGVGGGKALDTAKTVAYYEKKPVIVVPTIASSDAPCSSLAVLYTEDGAFEECLFFNKNPEVVLVDVEIISQAPARFLVSGMGDALATFFEARSCVLSGAKNIPGGTSTKAAMALAKLCYETLLEDSLKALAASNAHVVTPAFENIVEAAILLSGLGFESSGLAAAHAIHNGLTALKETHHCLHGEKVAFGVLVHLVLENAAQEEIDQVIQYCKSVGLPTALTSLEITDPSEQKIMAVAERACAETDTMRNMPFPIDSRMVYAAIRTADALGSR